MNSKIIPLSLILFMVITASSCMQKKHSPPQYLSDPNACSIIKNSSLRFKDIKTQNLWFGVNKAIVEFSRDELIKNKKAVKKLIFDPKNNIDTIDLLTSTIKNYKCKRIIQIQHVHNPPHDFGYDVDILIPNIDDFTPNKESSYTLVSVYEKRYRYPLTKESFDNLIVSDLGKKIASDILRSGALSK